LSGQRLPQFTWQPPQVTESYVNGSVPTTAVDELVLVLVLVAPVLDCDGVHPASAMPAHRVPVQAMKDLRETPRPIGLSRLLFPSCIVSPFHKAMNLLHPFRVDLRGEKVNTYLIVLSFSISYRNINA